jgi:hypothetical protein
MFTTALSGTHTIGQAHKNRSGYSGMWSDSLNQQIFNNNYYVSILTKGWGPNRKVFGN